MSSNEKIQDSLKEVNIDTAIHYPNILPNTDIYKEENYDSLYPSSAIYIKNIFSIPFFAELTVQEMDKVSSELLKF